MSVTSFIRQSPVASNTPWSFTPQLAIWLVMHLIVVALAAARVPLAARYPEPAEQLAPHLLLCVQIIATGLLFPWLLRDARTTAQILATALPFQLAAAFLSGNSIRHTVPAIAYVDGFIAVLAIWSPVLRSNLAQSLGIALASCLTLGGGMLRYLRVEYSGGRGASVPHTWETVTPLPSTLYALENQFPAGGWILIAVLAIVAITIRLTHHRRISRASAKPQKSGSSPA
jgi:hypothetical protein